MSLKSQFGAYIRRRMVPNMPEILDELEFLKSKVAELEGRISQEPEVNPVNVDAISKSNLRTGFLSALHTSRSTVSDRRYRSDKLVKSLDESLSELEAIVPHAFEVWRKLLNVNANAYEGFPLHSCSVAGHPSAEFFRYFTLPRLKGQVLDIGCGPQPVPIYMSDYPVDLISGIDPISAAEDHPFEFHSGVAEFLPWEADTFGAVIAATSLDHVLLLDKVYDEVQRVLRPDGHFIVWLAYMDGAVAYDPYREEIEPIDEYHLFHFDEEWFLDDITKKFDLIDHAVVNFSIDHQFFCFRPKN